MAAFGQREGDLLEDGAVGAVDIEEQFPVHIETGTVIGAKLEGVVLALADVQFRIKENGKVIGRIWQVFQIQVGFHARQVRGPEGGEVRQITLGPVEPELIVDYRVFFLAAGTGQQESQHGQQKQSDDTHLCVQLMGCCYKYTKKSG